MTKSNVLKGIIEYRLESDDISRRQLKKVLRPVGHTIEFDLPDPRPAELAQTPVSIPLRVVIERKSRKSWVVDSTQELKLEISGNRIKPVQVGIDPEHFTPQTLYRGNYTIVIEKTIKIDWDAARENLRKILLNLSTPKLGYKICNHTVPAGSWAVFTDGMYKYGGGVSTSPCDIYHQVLVASASLKCDPSGNFGPISYFVIKIASESIIQHINAQARIAKAYGLPIDGIWVRETSQTNTNSGSMLFAYVESEKEDLSGCFIFAKFGPGPIIFLG